MDSRGSSLRFFAVTLGKKALSFAADSAFAVVIAAPFTPEAAGPPSEGKPGSAPRSSAGCLCARYSIDLICVTKC